MIKKLCFLAKITTDKYNQEQQCASLKYNQNVFKCVGLVVVLFNCCFIIIRREEQRLFRHCFALTVYRHILDRNFDAWEQYRSSRTQRKLQMFFTSDIFSNTSYFQILGLIGSYQTLHRLLKQEVSRRAFIRKTTEMTQTLFLCAFD